MNTRADLLAAVRRNRAADLPRLAFCDYLQETGCEPIWEQFIRESVNHPTSRIDPSLARPLLPTTPTNGIRCSEWSRGFLEELECSWDWWSANAAQILPDNPGLERVVLTTRPRTTRTKNRDRVSTYRLEIENGRASYLVSDLEAAHFRDTSVLTRLIHESLLRQEWGGDPAEGGWGVTFELPRERQRGRYVLSVGEEIGSDAEGRAVPAAAAVGNPLGRVHSIRPNQHVRVHLYDAWGNATAGTNDIEIGFLPDDPDAHGGQYRHWQDLGPVRYGRIDRITQLVAGMAEQDAAATERILRDLLAEHGITEDDLRAGRRQVTRVTTDGRPGLRVMCECQRTPISDLLREPGSSLEEIMNRQIEVIELRDRRWNIPSRTGGTNYRVADGICPRCSRLYFAVTRVER